VIAGIIGAVSFKMYLNTKAGSRQWDWFTFNMPVFGDLFRKVALSRFTKTLATLLESGVNMLGSLEIVAGVAGNILVEEAVMYARDQVSRGKQLSEPLGESKIFPPLICRMVAVGEKTGQLEGLLKKISEFYDHEVRATVKALTSILEPILIAAMGLVVGTIVLAIFLPIIELQKKLGGAT
jgi:type IV pilus assembly protein PilC